MADADQGPYLEPPYRLPSPDSPVAPPVLRKPQSQDEPDEGEGQQDDTDEGTVSNATPTTTRPETPQAPGGEPSPSGRRVWGLRSPIMMNRLSFYSDSSRSPLSPLRQLSSSLIPSPAFVSKDGGGGDADDELDTDELEGMDKDSDTDSLTQDSKDVLVERLNDLVKNLAAGRRLQSADISALHAKVDEMESLVPATHQVEAQRKRKPRSSLPRQDSRGAQSTNPLHVTQQGHEAVTGEATTESTTPLEFSGEVSPFPAVIPSPSTPGPAGAVARPQANARVVAEAEKLNMELTKVFENMKARSIESDHLHRLLIERAEGAAMRIIELEKKVSELVGNLDDSEVDLKHLRLRLRAIESMFHEHMAQDVDPVLYQSIEDWKADWASLRERMAKENNSHRPPRAVNDDTTATNISSFSGRDSSS